MPIRIWVRHIPAQVTGSSLMDLMSGAWVRMTPPADLIRRTASAAREGSSSRGWEKCAMRARLLPAAATSSNSRRVSSASGSLTNRCGQ